MTPAWTLDRLMAARGGSEYLSDLLIRMAKAEAMASNCSPVQVTFRA
jgi:hypothetical protein